MAARAGGASQVATDPESLLTLQHTAGNKAVSRLLDGQAASHGNVIRRLTMKSSDLDSVMGRSDKGTLGMGKSSFAVVKSEFEKYEKAKAAGQPQQQLADLLADLDTKVTKWLNEHRKKLGDQDLERRDFMQQLSEELMYERRDLSKTQAHDEYMGAIKKGKGQAKSGGFHALTGQRPMGAADDWERELQFEQNARVKGATPDKKSPHELKVEKRRAVAQKQGVTRAEQAAFGVYTQGTGDFEYINPAAAGHTGERDPSRDRLAEAKKSKLDYAERFKNLPQYEAQAAWGMKSNQTLREEGALHMAMIVSGLQRLEPYKGESYRGEALTEGVFKERAKVGKPFSFPNVTSSSKEPVVAQSFAGKNCNETNDIQVYWVFTNAGKDVEMFSMEENEGEVLIEPSEKFVVDRIVDLDALDQVPSEGAKLYNHLKGVPRTKAARKRYVVHVMKAPTGPAPQPPGAPPGAQQPAVPALPALPAKQKTWANVQSKGEGRNRSRLKPR